MTEKGIPEIQGRWRRMVISLFHLYFCMKRGMTLGVRAACFDAEGRVFLVRHTYVPGWYLPGGGVERDETVGEALLKELHEEGNLEPLAEPTLVHVYFNRNITRRDHVVFYRVDVRQTAPREPDREIAQSGFFSLDQLPENVTQATLDRLAELRGEKPFPGHW